MSQLILWETTLVNTLEILAKNTCNRPLSGKCRVGQIEIIFWHEKVSRNISRNISQIISPMGGPWFKIKPWAPIEIVL